MITLDNYELFALDFLEGGLDPKRNAEFEKFLLLHPDIKEELNSIYTTHLPEMDEEIQDFSHLKKKRIAVWVYWSMVGVFMLTFIGYSLFDISNALDQNPSELPLNEKTHELEKPEQPYLATASENTSVDPKKDRKGIMELTKTHNPVIIARPIVNSSPAESLIDYSDNSSMSQHVSIATASSKNIEQVIEDEAQPTVRWIESVAAISRKPVLLELNNVFYTDKSMTIIKQQEEKNIWERLDLEPSIAFVNLDFN